MEWTAAVFEAFAQRGAGGAGPLIRQLEDSDIISLDAALTQARTKLSREKLGELILWIDPGWGTRGGRKCNTFGAVGLAASRMVGVHKKSLKAATNAMSAAKSNKRRCHQSTIQGPAKRTRRTTAEERSRRDSQKAISFLEQQLQEVQRSEKKLVSQLRDMQESRQRSGEAHGTELDNVHGQLQQLLLRNCNLTGQMQKLQQAKLKVVEDQKVLRQQLDGYLDAQPSARQTRAKKRVQTQTEAKRESRHQQRVAEIQAQLGVLAQKSKALAGKSKLRRKCSRLKGEVERLAVSYDRLIELEDSLAPDEDQFEERGEDWASDADQNRVVSIPIWRNDMFRIFL
jgi:chromosome segregation ATPase